MKRVFAILLTFILLLSNSGISIATHFCGEVGSNTHLQLGEDESHMGCGMEEPHFLNYSEEGQYIIAADDCCSNHFSSLAIEDSYTKLAELSFSHFLNFITPLALTHFITFAPVLNEQIPATYYYTPPPDRQDLVVFVQSFLI